MLLLTWLPFIKNCTTFSPCDPHWRSLYLFIYKGWGGGGRILRKLKMRIIWCLKLRGHSISLCTPSNMQRTPRENRILVYILLAAIFLLNHFIAAILSTTVCVFPINCIAQALATFVLNSFSFLFKLSAIIITIITGFSITCFDF